MKIVTNILLLLIIISCNKDNNCFTGKGAMIESVVELNSFEKIEILENINFKWVKDTSYFVVVKGDELLIPNINLSIENSELFIENKNSCTWIREDIPTIWTEVHSPFFSNLRIKGSGKIMSNDSITNNVKIESYINQGSIDFKIWNDSTKIILESGGIDLTIVGKSNFTYIYPVGYHHVLLKNFEVKKMHINHNSWGKNEINVTDQLLVEKYGEGNIYYWGNPNQIIISADESDAKLIQQ